MNRCAACGHDNPAGSNIKNFFADPERYELGDLIDHILTTQVEISWEQEVAELERHGLNDAKSILDIGTGTGLFLCHMASRFPKKRFVGVDTSERLIERARNTAREMKLTNVSFILGQCPMQLEYDFDYILARLTVYCSPEPNQLLSWAHKVLEPSGRIAIIELDYDWIYTYPHDPIIEKMFMEHRREFERHGADCSIGKKLPSILLQAGFAGVSFGTRAWWSSYELEKEQFFDLFSNYGAFSLRIAPETFTRSDYEYLIGYLNRVANSKSETVAYPKIVACAVKR